MAISLAQKSRFWVEQSVKFIIYKAQGISFYSAIVRSLDIDIEIKETISPKIIKKEVTDFVAKHGKRKVGYVQLIRKEISDQSPEYWLFSLTVNIFYRRLGIGRKLTEAVINKAKEEGANTLHLFVYNYNYRAIDFYKRLGFRQVIIPLLEVELEKERQYSGVRRITMIKDLA